MTLTESILSGGGLILLTSYLTLLINGKKKVTSEEFEKHKESLAPHPACPVHERWLKDVDKKLDRLDGKIDKLLER